MSCLDPEIFKNQSRVEGFVCVSGMGVPFIPVIDLCGHTYCRDCYRRFLFSGSGACPLTRLQLNSDMKTVNKNYALSFLDEEELKCPHFEAGCQWNGKVKDLEAHLVDECPHAMLFCPYLGCSESSLTREEYQSHLDVCLYKPIECRFCKETYTKMKERSHYDHHCKEKPIFCGHCNDLIANFDKNHHPTNCPSIKRKCPYIGISCRFEGNLKQMKNHLTDPISMMDHLSKQTKMILKLGQQIKDLQKKQCSCSEKKSDETDDTSLQGLFE